MCGIAGMLDLSGRKPVPAQVVRHMAAAIVHRGPDEDGFLDRPGVALANRRLSIVGLADGRQPIATRTAASPSSSTASCSTTPEEAPGSGGKGHRSAPTATPRFSRTCGRTTARACSPPPRPVRRRPVGRTRNAGSSWAATASASARCTGHRGRPAANAGGDWLLFASEIKALLASGMVEADGRTCAASTTCSPSSPCPGR